MVVGADVRRRVMCDVLTMHQMMRSYMYVGEVSSFECLGDVSN